MTSTSPRWPLAMIEIGACVFIAALLLSLLFEAAVWLLHTLQALIYVSVILLARRRSAWGFGAGLTIAALWNTANLFFTGFTPAGLRALFTFLRHGHLTHPAMLLVLLGTVGHFLMIIGCVVCFQRNRPRLRGWAELAGGAVLVCLALVAISPLRHHPVPLPLDVWPMNDRMGPLRAG